MAAKKQRNTAGNSLATEHPSSKSSLWRFFSDQPELQRRNKIAPPESKQGSQPSSPSKSECSTDGNDIRALLSQMTSKMDIAAMFQRLEESFSDKLQAVSADVQQLGTRVQAL
ncbi:Hypothetical predicted protein [Pelobates cultripes]|uniref:Uncharacterized protein n=1 Tax=Pelobates cultripes TaxID=61616 RepID=A0AAD1TC47_PELCU|nr:Hypothetical predicted protein [Pelobates cultripes]